MHPPIAASREPMNRIRRFARFRADVYALRLMDGRQESTADGPIHSGRFNRDQSQSVSERGSEASLKMLSN
jgi:hypothetical protein